MVKRKTVGRRYTKYSVTSLAIASALLAVNPAEVQAQEVDETIEEANEHTELVDERTADESPIDAEAAQANGEAILEQETEITEQDAIVEEAQETVDENQETVNEIEEELAQVETEATAIEQEISELEEDAEAVDELEEAIAADEENAESLEAEITETEVEQEAIQNEVDNLEAEVEAIQQTVAEEEETLTDLQEERDQLAEQPDQAPIGENEITLPDGYIEALSSYGELSNPTAEDNQAMEEVALPGLELNAFESQAEDQERVIEDPTNLDNDIAIELAQFTASLLNPIRSAFGNEEMLANQDAINMANDIADTYERDQVNGFESNGHHVTGITEVAGEYGLNDGNQYYENLGVYSEPFGRTLADLKHNIYSMITRMLFEDAHATYGHSLSLVGEMNNGVAVYIGVAFSEVPAQEGNIDAYSTHLITVPNSPVYLQDSTTFDTTANYPYTSEDVSDEREALDAQIEEQVQVVEAARARLSEAENALSDRQAALGTVNDRLENLRNELDVVNTRLDTQRGRLEELQNAEALLADLEAQLADKITERAALYQVYGAAQATLAQLQAELEELKQSPYSFPAERTEEIAYDTEWIYNPDLLVGTEEVSQAGVNGVLWLLEQIVYLNDEIVDRFVVSSNVVVEPVSEIVQVGTGAAEIEDIATPNEPLTPVPSEDAEETDDAVELEQGAEETEDTVAPEQPAEPEETTEPRETEETVDSLESVFLEAEAEESSQETLPNTGTTSSAPLWITGLFSILAGVGISSFPKRKRK